jgi:hypothetical protein
MREKLVCGILGLTTAFTTGCMNVGPSVLRSGRPAYNMAVQSTNDQELLLNLVRSRYRDTLYFTSVERIAATQEIVQGMSTSVGHSETRSDFAVPPTGPSVVRTITNPFALGANVSVNEKPTIFYAPVEGEKFVRQMMTPMNPDLLLLLVKSG